MYGHETRHKETATIIMNRLSDIGDMESKTIVITSIGVLKSAIQEWAAEQLQAEQQARKEELISEAVVKKRLHVSRSTLWRWNKTGYLCWQKVGGRKAYKLSDIEKIEKGVL